MPQKYIQSGTADLKDKCNYEVHMHATIQYVIELDHLGTQVIYITSSTHYKYIIECFWRS